MDDRRRDGGTNFILRIKKQETRLTFQEHDDDDDEFVSFYCCAELNTSTQILCDLKLWDKTPKVCIIDKFVIVTKRQYFNRTHFVVLQFSK